MPGIGMPLRVLITAAALFSLHPAVAQDYASWVRFSDSTDNSLIIEMIEQGELSSGLEAAAALGSRRDPLIQDIILAVGQSVDQRPAWERELLLRVMLRSVLPPSLERSEWTERLKVNREAIDFLAANLPHYDPPLKREIIRILGFLTPPGHLSTLMWEGRQLGELLLTQSGELNGEQAGLALAYLDTVGRIGDPEFANVVLFILERCRHMEVAEKARSVSRSLLL
jgi:hypothetical protein